METIYADFEEILFENKEKAYGAYKARRDRAAFLSIAAAIALFLFTSSTFLPKVIDWITPEPQPEKEEVVLYTEADLEAILEELPEEEEEEEELEEIIEVEPPAPVQASTIDYQQIEVVPDDEAEDVTIADQDDVDNTDAEAGFEDVFNPDGLGGDFDGELDGKLGADETEIKETPKNTLPNETDFIPVEKEPKPVNLSKLKELIGYPEPAKQNEIEGRVIARVLIGEDGKPIKYIIKNKGRVHTLLSSAVERHIMKVQCTPGIQNNKPVKVWVTIPFNFQLSN